MRSEIGYRYAVSQSLRKRVHSAGSLVDTRYWNREEAGTGCLNVTKEPDMDRGLFGSEVSGAGLSCRCRGEVLVQVALSLINAYSQGIACVGQAVYNYFLIERKLAKCRSASE